MSNRQPTGAAPGTAPPSAGGEPRRPLDPVALRRAGQLTARFGLLALAAVLATSLPLPWGLAGIAFTLAAVAVGIMALVAVVRARLRAATVVMISIGLGLVGLLLLSQLGMVLFYDVTRADQQCRTAAITDQAQQQCTDQRQGRLLDSVFGP